MRTLGVAVLGLFGGLLLGFVGADVLAVAAGATTGGFADSPLVATASAWLTPLAAVLGVVAALAIDHRRRGNGRPTDPS